MKRLLLLIAVSIVWSGSVLQAQEYEYVPLVREGIEWGYKNGEIYRFIGEEIINGKVYKQLGNSSRDYPDSYKIAGYAREENKVVYRLYSKDAEEVPIYDFNVKQVGDIMQAWHTEPGYFGMKVESLDSILVNGKYRKMIKLENQRGECIEGIGSTETGYNILYPFYQITSEFDEKTKNKLEYVKNTATGKNEWQRPNDNLDDKYEYVPLVREGVEWGYTGDLGDYRCQIKGDTIIDGTTYKKFYRYTTCGLQKNTPCYVVVRENDKKVYYREITGDNREERLIYDFSLEKGDMSILYSRSALDYMQIDVRYVDTIQVGSTYRKRLEYLIHDVIEGIGGLKNDWLVAAFTIAPCVPDCNVWIYLSYVKNLVTGEYEYGNKGACGDTYAYDPYVKDCNFGFYHHDPEDRYIWDIDVFAHYYITGKKAVNGKIYKQFVESKSCDYASGTEIALIREEDKKVYLLDGEKEWLWYDFTLEKGDTITIESASPLNPSGEKLKIPVVNTDTFEIGGKLRKRIYLRGYDTWIEGLGTENRLPLHSFEPSCGMDCGDKLYYQRIGDKISYLDNYFIHDLLEPCTSSVLDTQIEALRIARTPDALIVTLPGTGYRLAELTEMTGRLAWCAYLDSEAEGVTIPTAPLSPGAYIVTLSNDRGERIVQKVMIQ